MCSTARRYLIGAVYRPPKGGYFSEVGDPLRRFVGEYSDILILGDFNTDPSVECFNSCQMNSVLSSYGMHILPLSLTNHTHTTAVQADTWIDHIFVSDVSKVVRHDQVHVLGISTHDLIFLSY